MYINLYIYIIYMIHNNIKLTNLIFSYADGTISPLDIKFLLISSGNLKYSNIHIYIIYIYITYTSVNIF